MVGDEGEEVGHVGFGGVGEVGVGGGCCFEAEADVFAAAGDGGPVDEFVGGGGGGGFLAFGGGGGGHGSSDGAFVVGWKMGGKCESDCGYDDTGAGTAEGGDEHLL